MANPNSTGMSRRRLMTVGAGSAALAGVAMGSNFVAAQDATPAAGGGTASTLALTIDGAMAIVNAAMAKATEIGVPTVVAVVDSAGTIKALARMDGTPNSSIDLATDKAFTAASFHAATDQFGPAVAADPVTLASILKAPGITLLPGGVPLMVGDVLVGAVGCSGGTGDQDVECANAGAAALAAG
jgi:glc operon protein GlcG